MSTNAIYADYKPAYYANAQQIAAQTSSNSAEEVSVYASNDNDSAKTVDVDYACTDGKDDGKISTGEKLESVGKGVLKSAINLVTSPFTEAAKGNFIPALAVTAGALLCATPLGAPIAVIGGAIGIAKGIGTIVTGVKKADEIANSGTGTDGEAKAAYEQVGSGVLTTGLSATAVLGGLKTMKARGGKMAELGKDAKFGDKVRAFKDDTITAGKDTFGKLTHKTTNTAVANNANDGQQLGQSETQTAAGASSTTSQSGQDISGATKLTKSQKATLTPDELSAYQTNRNAYCNPKGSKPSSQTQQGQSQSGQAQAGSNAQQTQQTQQPVSAGDNNQAGQQTNTPPASPNAQVQTNTSNGAQTQSTGAGNNSGGNSAQTQQQVNTPVDKAVAKLQSEQEALTRLMNNKPDKLLEPEAYNEWLKDVARCDKIVNSADNSLTILQNQLDDAYFNAGFDT